MNSVRAMAPAGADRAPWHIWRRWVLANIVGEVVGFGLAALIGAVAAQSIAALSGGAQVAAMIGATVAIGSVEGALVGLAQWLVLRRWWPTITWRAWLLATVIGAVVAWGAGMAIGSLAGDQLETVMSGSPVVPALVIGLVAGTLLSLFQWPVLRRVTPRAGWWVPAHAIAWAVGMVVAFGGMSVLAVDTPLPVVVVVGAGTGLAMGGLVAALTGLVLLKLHQEAVTSPTSEGPAVSPGNTSRP